MPGEIMGYRLEKRLSTPTSAVAVTYVFSILLAVVFCGLFLAFSGRDPVEIYAAMLKGALGSSYGLSETAVKAIPLTLCGLGIAVAFRMQLWNIGAEGQLYLGAFAATWLPLSYPELPMPLMLGGMLMLGMTAGAVWGLIPAFLKAKWQVNEIITSLMLNYVGIQWVSYLVYGPWRDPQGLNFPLTAQFPAAALLPAIPGTRIHIGLLLALLLVFILAMLFANSRWGYEIRVIGAGAGAARYAGMDIRRNIYLVMLLSGAICGLAGMTEVSGIAGRLQIGLSPGYGYTGIIVAWLARLNPFAVALAAALFGALQVGGYYVQTMGVPASVSSMIQGAVLFFVLGGEFFAQFRIVRAAAGAEGVTVHE